MAKKQINTNKDKPLKKVPILHSNEKGSPFYEENRVSGEDLNDSIYLKWCYRAIDLFKQGVTRQLVVETLLEESKGKLSYERINDIVVTRARQIISLEYEKNDKFVIGLHLQRYKKEISSFHSKIAKVEKSKKYLSHIKLQMIASHYYSILDIMFHIERLLQLHNKKVILRVNQINNTFIQKEKSKFNLSTLTFEEKKDFLELLLKSKKTDNEMYGVKLTEKLLNSTEEIQDVEIIEETNVSKIKEVIPDQEEQREEGLALLDAFEKLKHTLQKKAEEEFKRVGGKV